MKLEIRNSDRKLFSDHPIGLKTLVFIFVVCISFCYCVKDIDGIEILPSNGNTLEKINDNLGRANQELKSEKRFNLLQRQGKKRHLVLCEDLRIHIP